MFKGGNDNIHAYVQMLVSGWYNHMADEALREALVATSVCASRSGVLLERGSPNLGANAPAEGSPTMM